MQTTEEPNNTESDDQLKKFQKEHFRLEFLRQVAIQNDKIEDAIGYERLKAQHAREYRLDQLIQASREGRLDDSGRAEMRNLIGLPLTADEKTPLLIPTETDMGVAVSGQLSMALYHLQKGEIEAAQEILGDLEVAIIDKIHQHERQQETTGKDH